MDFFKVLMQSGYRSGGMISSQNNTGSPESAMEFDLARLREIKDADSPRSPSLFAYYAALNLLDAKVLFSNER